jgi:hypothetical protein
MEYCRKADAWLSQKVQRSSMALQVVMADGLPRRGQSRRSGLISDEVQGRKQFIQDLRGRNARNVELDRTSTCGCRHLSSTRRSTTGFAHPSTGRDADVE